MDSVATSARLFGLRWDTARISALERGKVSPTVPTLYVLANALTQVTGSEVSLIDLIQTNGFVELNDHLAVRGSALTSALSGGSAKLDDADRYLDPREIAEAIRTKKPSDRIQFVNALRASPEADQRLARSLGIPLAKLHSTAQELWGGRSFSEERDHRAGPDANAQKRGRISRELKAEIQERLDRGDD